MKNQNFKFAIVFAILQFMFFECSLYGQGVNAGYPGPGNTTIYDRPGSVVVADESDPSNNLTWVNCDEHPDICDKIREKHPRPGTPPEDPKEPKDPKKPKEPKQPKQPKQPKKPKKQSLPPGITDEVINELKRTSKTGMAVIKNGKWVDIFDFDGHIESLIKNK
jgi:hypothetical protein